jgi:rhodanese-related sulfurtransferase
MKKNLDWDHGERMRNIIIFILLLLNACSPSETSMSFDQMVEKTISKFRSPVIRVGELKRKLESKKKLLLLDAREIEEVNTSTIPGAIMVGHRSFDLEKVKQMLGPTSDSKEIIVYCSIGYRSGEIADRLLDEGYTVYNLFGGIFDWVNQGNQVIDQNKLMTNKIHTYNQSWSQWVYKGEKVF